jgi:hypothetical protein
MGQGEFASLTAGAIVDGKSCDDASVRRWVIAGVAVAVVAASAVVLGAAVLHTQREREWAHGGDGLGAEVEIVLATPQTFDEVAVRLGVPPGAATRSPGDHQSIVVRVRWSGLPRPDDSLQLIVLDGRLTPPRPLSADAGWNLGGTTGSQWASAYESLADHYDWLAGVAAGGYTDATGLNHLPAAAVHAGSGRSGTVTGWFRQWGDSPVPLADPTRDIIVALVDVGDDGEVRWARRVSG